MKTKILTLIIAVAICPVLKGQDLSPAQFESLLQELRVERQSKAFKDNRAGIFRQIELKITGLEKLPELTTDQKKWVMWAGKRGKAGNPFYKPYLPRLYKIYYEHKEK